METHTSGVSQTSGSLADTVEAGSEIGRGVLTKGPRCSGIEMGMCRASTTSSALSAT